MSALVFLLVPALTQAAALTWYDVLLLYDIG